MHPKLSPKPWSSCPRSLQLELQKCRTTHWSIEREKNHSPSLSCSIFHLVQFYSFHEFVSYLLFLFFLIWGFHVWWSCRLHGVTLIFLYLLRFALCLNMWRVFEKVPWAFMRSLGDMFCKYLLGPFGLWYQLVPVFVCIVFVWMNWAWGLEFTHYQCMRIDSEM